VIFLPLQFQTELKPEHVREATAAIFWRQTLGQPLSLLGFLVLVAVALGVFVALVPGWTWWWYAVSLGLMIAVVFGVLAMASRYYQELALHNFSRFKDAPVRVSLEQGAYRYEAAWGEGAIEWTRFQSLWCLKNAWVLLQHVENGASVVLPVLDLDGASKTFLKERMAQVGAQVRD